MLLQTCLWVKGVLRPVGLQDSDNLEMSVVWAEGMLMVSPFQSSPTTTFHVQKWIRDHYECTSVVTHAPMRRVRQLEVRPRQEYEPTCWGRI